MSTLASAIATASEIVNAPQVNVVSWMATQSKGVLVRDALVLSMASQSLSLVARRASDGAPKHANGSGLRPSSS